MWKRTLKGRALLPFFVAKCSPALRFLGITNNPKTHSITVAKIIWVCMGTAACPKNSLKELLRNLLRRKSIK